MAKERMMDRNVDSVSRRQRQLEREEQELQELLEKATQKDPAQEEPEKKPEEQASENAGEKETSKPEPVKAPEKEELSKEEETYKKRYGDARTYINTLKDQIKTLKDGGEAAQVPTDPEEVENWVKEHPKVAAIVSKLAENIADQRVAQTEERFASLEEERAELELKKLEAAVTAKHKDFDKLKEDDKFHNWLEEQPKFIQDSVYDNTKDSKALIRAIDLYKLDTKKSEPPMAVNTRGKSKVESQRTGEGSTKIWTREEISSLSLEDYAKYEKDIDTANREGRIQ